MVRKDAWCNPQKHFVEAHHTHENSNEHCFEACSVMLIH